MLYFGLLAVFSRIVTLHGIVWINHSLFIHFTVDEHLGSDMKKMKYYVSTHMYTNNIPT